LSRSREEDWSVVPFWLIFAVGFLILTSDQVYNLVGKLDQRLGFAFWI
jgi:hypothetical protein